VHGFTMLSSTLEEWVSSAMPARPELWLAAVRLFRQHPLLGVGPDNFRRRYPEVIAPKSGKKYDDDRLHANSFYFETLADLGIFGVAALVLLLVALGRAVLAHARARRLPLLACGIAAALFFVHGLLDYFLEFTPLYGLFWLTLGLTASGARSSE
jgi:O-antigen ligase